MLLDEGTGLRFRIRYFAKIGMESDVAQPFEK
jgi:hypothetical protein